MFLDPFDIVKRWRPHEMPEIIPWPSLDDSLWPEDMPQQKRSAPDDREKKYYWDMYEWRQFWPRSLFLGGVLIGLLGGWGAWTWWSIPFVGMSLLVIASLAGMVACQVAPDWVKADTRDWSHLVTMWPQLKIREWTDLKWQDRPTWWPNIFWRNMSQGTYRKVVMVLAFPIVLPLALALFAMLIGAIIALGVGCFDIAELLRS